MRATLDFPEPDSPTMPTVSPRHTSKLTSSTARSTRLLAKAPDISRYSLTRCSTRSTGSCATTPERRFDRSEEHTSELQSLMRISYAVFCLKKKKQPLHTTI